jgi:hypothetical protein
MPPRKKQVEEQGATPQTDRSLVIRDPSMDVKILVNHQEFKWNSEEIKAALLARVERYRNLVVNEDNLPDMERTQKEIAGLRIRIDKFRIETKKLLSEPANQFDKEVKDFLLIIAEVELPISKQVAKYEDERVAKRTEELAAFAKEHAAKISLRDEWFKFEVPAKLTNRSVSDTAAKREITATLDDLLAQQGADDTVKEETRRREEETLELTRQRDAMIELLCSSHSTVMGLKTPITLADIQPLIAADSPIASLPDIIVAECKKRHQVEQAAAAPPTEPPRSVSYTHPENCGCHDCLPGSIDDSVHDLPPAITSAPQTGSNFSPPPPVRPPWAGPPPTAPQLFEVVLRFPAISIVNAGALQLWLSDSKIAYEVVSQEPVKGAENE